MKYQELYEVTKQKLESAGVEDAGLDARLLLEYVCGTKRGDLFAHGDREVANSDSERLIQLAERRMKRVPLQHLTGTQGFMGLLFTVDENVLIPRQDTEILVEEAMKQLHDGMRILDLCTGSGCILVSLLHYSNGCTGVGTDLSGAALKVAAENAARLLTDAGAARFLECDLFDGVDGKFDIIVSNPPYIPTGEIPSLMPEVRDHEPRMALDGREDGLYFYRKIIPQATGFLERGGMLFLEIGMGQACAVRSLMEGAGFLEVEVVRDYAGLDRVVYGTYCG